MSAGSTSFNERVDAVIELSRDGAIAEYLDAAQALVNDFPKQPGPWLLLATALSNVFRYEEALRAIDRSISLGLPEIDHATPFAWKGNMYSEKGNYRAAEHWYRKAVDVEPRNALILACLGDVVMRQGRLAEAKEIFRKQIRIDSETSAVGHVFLAEIYRSEQSYKIALRHVDKVLAIDSTQEEAKLLRADLLAAMRRRVK